MKQDFIPNGLWQPLLTMKKWKGLCQFTITRDNNCTKAGLFQSNYMLIVLINFLSTEMAYTTSVTIPFKEPLSLQAAAI